MAFYAVDMTIGFGARIAISLLVVVVGWVFCRAIDQAQVVMGEYFGDAALVVYDRMAARYMSD